MSKILVTILKVVAVVFAIVLAGMAVGSRPGYTHRIVRGVHYTYESFFEMTIITVMFAFVSLVASLIGGTKNSTVQMVDAGAHLLLGIWLIMYTTHAMEISLNRYNDMVTQTCGEEPEVNAYESVLKSAKKSEEEDLIQCGVDNPSNPYEACVCRVKVVSKYLLTLVTFVFGYLSSFTHLGVGLVALMGVKKD